MTHTHYIKHINILLVTSSNCISEMTKMTKIVLKLGNENKFFENTQIKIKITHNIRPKSVFLFYTREYS